MRHEKQLRLNGHRVIAGIDEAGRGTMAGPLCVAAVILPERFRHKVLTDSKQLQEKQRDELYEELVTDARVRWHCEVIAVEVIDRINILQATWLGMRQCALALAADAALIDGLPVRDFPVHQVAVVKGDSASYSIAAASIVAKVTRDRFMRQLALEYPQYGFENHKGYCTREHQERLRLHGPCAQHRRSFEPVAQRLLPLWD